MKRILYLLILIITICNKANGQDPQFTQFYSVPLYLAPSFAGATQQHRISSTFRKQWMALPGDFGSYTFAYDHYFSKFNSGVGILFLQDQAGSGKLGYRYIDVLYSYDFALNEAWHLRPGVSFIYSMYGLNFSKLVFGDQLRQGQSNNLPATIESSPQQENRGYLDGSASALMYSSKIWIGFTVDHLLMPNTSFYSEKSTTSLKFTSFGGLKIMSSSNLLKPTDESISLAYQFRMMKDFKQLDMGVYWYGVPWVIGFWYRGIPLVNSTRGDAVALLAGLKLRGLSIGYSYDFTISSLVNSTAGAHELSLIYEFQTQHKKRIHSIPCPEF